MQPTGQQVAAGEDGGDPGRPSFAQLQGDAVYLAHVQIISVHQLLVEYLPAEVDHHPPIS